MVGTFPLNIQAGSPQYTLTSQITPSSSTTTISVTNADSIEPISNAYYTIQNEDGSKWCTFYIGQWTKESTTNYYTESCTYSSSNTSDVFPEGSVCWCIWCKEYYDSLASYIPSYQVGVPTGAIMAFATYYVPEGWLLCDGSAVSKTEYANLFAVIGDTFGQSIETFNLPDLQARVVLGNGNSYQVGETGGGVSTTLTERELPSHTHSATISINNNGNHSHKFSVHDNSGDSRYYVSGPVIGSSQLMDGYMTTTGMHTHTATCSITSTGRGKPFSNMPPYLVLKYCIKT